MGKYDHLSAEEKRVLREMAEAYQARGTVDWLHVLDSEKNVRSYCLMPAVDYGTGRVSETVSNVPESVEFYRGLEKKGLVILGRRGVWANASLLKIHVQQPAVDYGDFAAKSGLGRWRENFTYSLVEETTLGAKLFWAVVGFALGVLGTIASAVALRLLP